MAKIEVEHRGSLNQKQFKELNKFLKKNGKFLEERDRFSIIYSSRGKESFKLGRSKIDLKLRITNKKTELVLKYGKWSGNDARKEFLFPVDSGKFEETIEFLFILGFYYGVLQATKSYLYLYKGIEIVLVQIPNFGYYFEAEMMAQPNAIKNSDKKILSVCKELKLNVFSKKDFRKLLQNLNNRPGFRFNFKRENFSDIKKRFKEYF